MWVALTAPAPADLVDALARALTLRLVSLDISPLTNPRTGALRPPGAPHRLGGASRVLAGDLGDLLAPAAGVDQVRALLALLDAPPPRRLGRSARRPVARDEHGHRHLPGERRALPAAASAALHDGTPAVGDHSTSAVLFAALCGVVRAHWRLADLIPLLEAAPGLEHARSGRHGPLRPLRSRGEALAVLTRQWDRAVAAVAGTDAAGANGDPTFEPRCAAAVDAVAAVQARADACPGRWARGGGPADRRVLDALCGQVLAAVRDDVELDIRRLADLTGIGRETARRALHRLAGDGWTDQAAAAEGTRPARWAVSAPPSELSTEQVTPGGSQAVPRPPGRARTAWRHYLARRLSSVAHDVFTPRPGLGHHAARAYAELSTIPQTRGQLVDVLGYSPDVVDRHLHRLHDLGLARPGPGTTWRRGRADRSAVAAVLGVRGVLARRRRRHQVEREAWAWWCDELAWMHLPRAAKRRRRDPAPGQTVLPLALLTARHRLGPHPRRPDGRADYAAARHHQAEQSSDTAA